MADHDYAKCKWRGKKFKKGSGLQLKGIVTLGLLGN